MFITAADSTFLLVNFTRMSQTVISVVIMLLAEILPKIGIVVGSEQLTTTTSTLIVVISGIWVWVRRWQQGDVKWFGARK